MFRRIDSPQQQTSQHHELQVSLDLRKQQPPQWLDQQSPKSIRSNKKTDRQQSRVIQQPDTSKKQINQSDQAVLAELGKQLQVSKRKLKRGLADNIGSRLEQMQYGVFVSETTSNNQEYLKALYKHTTPNKYIKDQIHETIYGAQKSIQEDIHSKDYKVQRRIVPRNKEQVRQMEKMDHYRLLRLKQGEVKNKVGSLRDQMDKQIIRGKLRRQVEQLDDVMVKNYYSMENPRTIQAVEFVRDIQERRKQEHRRYQNQQIARQQQKEMQRRQAAQQKQMQLMERKTRLKEYYQSRLQRRMEQRQIQQQKKEEFKEWIKEFQRQKPLQLEKQQEYKMRVVIPMLEQKHKKLMTIRAQHRPIDFDEIAQHQAKYLDLKKDNQQRKQAQLELKQQEDQVLRQEQDDAFFKGKYRYMVLEQIIEEKFPIDNREVEQSKKERIKAYNQHIRQLHSQTIAKHNTLEVNTLSPKSYSLPQDSKQAQNSLQIYKQGIKNLNFVKSLARDRIARDQSNPPIINFIQEKEITKTKGFLQDLRELRQKEGLGQRKKKIALGKAVTKEIKDTAISENEQISMKKAKVDMLEERLKLGEQKIKNFSDGNMKQGKGVEDDYVNAIKAKIHMLNQFN